MKQILACHYLYQMKFKLKYSCIIVVLFFLFHSLNLQATDYFVKTTGNNGNPGTNWSTAWQSIAYAGGTVGAGDVVYVSNGTYGEISVGTPANNISFISYNPGQACVDGNVYCMTLNNKTNINIQGFYFFSSTSYAIRAQNTCNISILNNKLDGGVYLENTKNTVIRSNLIYSGTYGILGNNAVSNTVVLNSIYNNGTGITFYGLSQFIYILSNQFYGPEDHAIYINLSTSSALVKIIRNLIYDINNYGIRIYAMNSGAAHIYNNTIFGCTSSGLRADVAGVMAYNNIFLSNSNYGIEVANGKALYGANNLFYGNSSGPTNNGKFYWTASNIFQNPMLDTVTSYTIASPYSAAVDRGSIIDGASDSYNEAAPDIGWKESPFAIPVTGEPSPSSTAIKGADHYEEIRVFPTLITADTDEIAIAFRCYEDGFIEISIINEAGKPVWYKNSFFKQDMQEIKWEPDKDLGTGIYLLYIRDAQGIKRKGRFLIIK